jgi:hypothetical protein
VTNVTANNNVVLNSATYGISVGGCTESVTLSLSHIGLAAYDGITIAPGASTVGCLGNSIEQVGQNGVTVQSGATGVSIGPEPVTGLGNTICSTGKYGIFVDVTNSSGIVAISGNIIDSVNQNKTTYVDVICIEGAGAGASVSIDNNLYMNTSNGTVNRLIESINTPLKEASGNTSTVTLPSLYTVL